MSKNEQVQRGHYFAMSTKSTRSSIDEARTPLIISGPVPESQQMYDELKEGVSHLVRSQRDLCNQHRDRSAPPLEVIWSLVEDDGEPTNSPKMMESDKRRPSKNSGLSARELRATKFSSASRKIPICALKSTNGKPTFFGEQNKEEKFNTPGRALHHRRRAQQRI